MITEQKTATTEADIVNFNYNVLISKITEVHIEKSTGHSLFK